MRFQQRRHQPLCHVDADVELTIPLPGGVLGSGFSTETVRLSSARWVGWLPRTAPLPKHDVGRALRAGHAVCGEVVSADDDQQACCSSALWSMLPECVSRWAARGDSRRFEVEIRGRLLVRRLPRPDVLAHAGFEPPPSPTPLLPPTGGGAVASVPVAPPCCCCCSSSSRAMRSRCLRSFCRSRLRAFFSSSRSSSASVSRESSPATRLQERSERP